MTGDIMALAVGGIADGQIIRGDGYSRHARAFSPAQEQIRELLEGPRGIVGIQALCEESPVGMVPNFSYYKLEIFRYMDEKNNEIDIPLWVETGSTLSQAIMRIFSNYRPVPYLQNAPAAKRR